MRIAQIATLAERVPPQLYGGIERVIYTLTEELVARGHDVTLFASGDSSTSGRLESVFPMSLREAGARDIFGANTWTLLNIGAAYARAHEFDIIHDHFPETSLPTANLSATPVVTTMHGAFTDAHRRMFEMLQKPYVVTLSDAQVVGGINHIGTVYNGLEMKGYPSSEERDDYMIYVGRMSYEKGVHVAIQAALRAGRPLKLAGKIDTHERIYFDRSIAPYLSNDIQWVGEVNEQERNALLSRAYCFLHPVLWPEPFGLTLIEAPACGCPVVAFSRGSIPEVVRDGITGFVAEDFEGMVSGIGKIDKIDRAQARAYVLEHFSGARMADGYESIYRRLVNNRK